MPLDVDALTIIKNQGVLPLVKTQELVVRHQRKVQSMFLLKILSLGYLV